MIETTASVTLRRAGTTDLTTLVRLHDGAARWMRQRRIDQWQPGQKDTAHFDRRIREGEVWLAELKGRAVGAYELWWQDEGAWGPQPPVAGYVHRLMTDRDHAPAGRGPLLRGDTAGEAAAVTGAAAGPGPGPRAACGPRSPAPVRPPVRPGG